jgi:hypothetical protein
LEEKGEKGEEIDSELDNSIGELEIAEHQTKKTRRILGSRLDESNPVVFSKRSSTYAFKYNDRVYKITIEADTFDMVKRSTTRSFRNALRSPAFIITSSLCLAIICVLAFVNVYWGSPVAGTFSKKELDTLDTEYSMILDHCAAFIQHHEFNPRSLGAQYAVCNKSIIQLQAFCQDHHMSVCQDQRIELYLTANKAMW